MRFQAYPRDRELERELQGVARFEELALFSRGFFRADERDGVVRVTDLRMGQEPAYVFSFAVARRGSALQPLQPSVSVGGRGDIDLAAGLRWLWARAGGEDLDPPGPRPLAGLRLWTCEVAYLPERRTWTRRVSLRWDGDAFAGMTIDGLRPHAVSPQGTVLITALDNERIELDLASMSWASDFRGLATGQGRCEALR